MDTLKVKGNPEVFEMINRITSSKRLGDDRPERDSTGDGDLRRDKGPTKGYQDPRDLERETGEAQQCQSHDMTRSQDFVMTG